jgi:cell division protein FtsL
MKTSNKLLLGLLILTILGIITVNIVYKTKLEYKQKNRIEVKSTNDSISSEQDSLAMEKAINNQ